MRYWEGTSRSDQQLYDDARCERPVGLFVNTSSQLTAAIGSVVVSASVWMEEFVKTRAGEQTYVCEHVVAN